MRSILLVLTIGFTVIGVIGCNGSSSQNDDSESDAQTQWPRNTPEMILVREDGSYVTLRETDQQGIERQLQDGSLQFQQGAQTLDQGYPSNPRDNQLMFIQNPEKFQPAPEMQSSGNQGNYIYWNGYVNYGCGNPYGYYGFYNYCGYNNAYVHYYPNYGNYYGWAYQPTWYWNYSYYYYYPYYNFSWGGYNYWAYTYWWYRYW